MAGTIQIRDMNMHPRVLQGNMPASPRVDSLIWSPSHDHFHFSINMHPRLEVTPTLTQCVQHGVFGEFRYGLCVMPIGFMPPDKKCRNHRA